MWWVLVVGLLGCSSVTEYSACAERAAILCDCGTYRCSSPEEIDEASAEACAGYDDENPLKGADRDLADCMAEETEYTCDAGQGLNDCCEQYSDAEWCQ